METFDLLFVITLILLIAYLVNRSNKRDKKVSLLAYFCENKRVYFEEFRRYARTCILYDRSKMLHEQDGDLLNGILKSYFNEANIYCELNHESIKKAIDKL